MRLFAWQCVAACVLCCGQDILGRQMQCVAECEVQLCATAAHDPVSIHAKQSCQWHELIISHMYEA